MGIFFTDKRPKGITKEELGFIRGELMSTSFGNGNEKLSVRQLDEVMEDLMEELDSDTAKDLKHGWKQVSEEEVEQIEENISNSKGMSFTPAQIEHVKRVLEKYLTIDRHKSPFSL